MESYKTTVHYTLLLGELQLIIPYFCKYSQRNIGQNDSLRHNQAHPLANFVQMRYNRGAMP